MDENFERYARVVHIALGITGTVIDFDSPPGARGVMKSVRLYSVELDDGRGVYHNLKARELRRVSPKPADHVE